MINQWSNRVSSVPKGIRFSGHQHSCVWTPDLELAAYEAEGGLGIGKLLLKGSALGDCLLWAR